MTRLVLNHGLSSLIEMIICINYLAKMNCLTDGTYMLYL